jgi:hypothetical protein
MLDIGEWRAIPEYLRVRVGSPERNEWIECDAVIDLARRRASVPANVYEQLNLPTWGLIEFDGATTSLSVDSSGDTLAHISQACLTGLGLEFNREMRQVRTVVPLLPLIVEE